MIPLHKDDKNYNEYVEREMIYSAAEADQTAYDSTALDQSEEKNGLSVALGDEQSIITCKCRDIGSGKQCTGFPKNCKTCSVQYSKGGSSCSEYVRVGFDSGQINIGCQSCNRTDVLDETMANELLTGDEKEKKNVQVEMIENVSKGQSEEPSSDSGKVSKRSKRVESSSGRSDSKDYLLAGISSGELNSNNGNSAYEQGASQFNSSMHSSYVSHYNICSYPSGHYSTSNT